jgi:hypothetical protein
METTKKSTFKVLFYLKKNAPKKNRKVAIMCRITVNSKQSAFSTKLDISATNWDLKERQGFGKKPRSPRGRRQTRQNPFGYRRMLFQNFKE